MCLDPPGHARLQQKWQRGDKGVCVGNEVDGREGREVGEKQEGFGGRVLKVGKDYRGRGGGGVEPRVDHNTFLNGVIQRYYIPSRILRDIDDTLYTTHAN